MLKNTVYRIWPFGSIESKWLRIQVMRFSASHLSQECQLQHLILLQLIETVYFEITVKFCITDCTLYYLQFAWCITFCMLYYIFYFTLQFVPMSYNCLHALLELYAVLHFVFNTTVCILQLEFVCNITVCMLLYSVFALAILNFISLFWSFYNQLINVKKLLSTIM